MSQASITITDDANTGQVTVAAEFGDQINDNSQAHQIASVLLNSVLINAKNYSIIEDTAPEMNVEPSRIVLPE